MAASVRNVLLMHKNFARYTEISHLVRVRFVKGHTQTKYFHATAYFSTDKPIKSEECDLDIFCVEELKQPKFQTESLDDLKCKRLQDIKAHYYTKLALQKSMPKLKALQEELPYGTIRYDKASAKRSSKPGNREERDQVEKQQIIERKKEKARKKLEKKAKKLELDLDKNKSCASTFSFDDTNEEDIACNENQNHESHTSYFDQNYYGNFVENDAEIKRSGKQCNIIEAINGDFDKHGKTDIESHKERKTKKNNVSVEAVVQQTHSSEMHLSFIDQAYFSGHERTHATEQTEKVDSVGFIDEQFFDLHDNSVRNGHDFSNQTPENISKKDDMMSNSIKTESVVSNRIMPAKRNSSNTNNAAVNVTDNHDFGFEDLSSNFDFPVAMNEQQTMLQQRENNSLEMKNIEKDHKTETTSARKKRERGGIRKGVANRTDNVIVESANSIASNSNQISREIDKLQSFQYIKNHAEIGNQRVIASRKRTIAQEFNGSGSSVHSAAQHLRKEYERKEKLDVHGRANPKEYDSKGLRILSGQTPDFQNVPRLEIIRVLRQNILFDSHDVVAVSKPYGLPLQGGIGKQLSIDEFLDDIIPSTTLHSIETMETGSTGVMLFAKTPDMKNTLSEKLKQGEICKKFLTITKNIPKLMQGEIDIPIIDGTVNGKHRMALRPHRTPDLVPVMPKRQPGRDAVTRYRVLDSKDNSYALLECIPLTTVKHQLRVHLAFGLNCPILGDHKYAHINKMAPMNLHPVMLQRLNIQQSKARYLALHLHCRSIAIPNFLNGKHLFVSAPFSVHFLANLRDLKLKLPPNC